MDQAFYTSFATRILIYAMAAASLNLVLGYGGMVSFGHAAFFGAGAYIVGILAVEGVTSLWIAWPVAIAVAALAALVIGAISLRTRGVYFIMITLAFAQMMYYVFVSLKAYGGDDGLSLPSRSTGLGFSLSNDFVWYYLVLAELAGVLYLLHRLLHSRFGRVIEAIRENETRATAVGYPVYRYKLLCFVISGAIAGLAGALIANQTSYVGPGAAALGAVGHADDHGDPGRRGPLLGRAGRRGGAARAGGAVLGQPAARPLFAALAAARGRDPPRRGAVRSAGNRRCFR